MIIHSVVKENGVTVGYNYTDSNELSLRYAEKQVFIRKGREWFNDTCTNAHMSQNGVITARKGMEKLKVSDRKSDELIIYHGTKNKILVPVFGEGYKNNDYGQGFYTTEDPEKAKEWAYFRGEDLKGYCKGYSIRMHGLVVLNLTEYNIHRWIALLLQNRDFRLQGQNAERRRRFIGSYGLDTQTVDVIYGYRADDSYFRYAQDFIEGNISLEMLERAVHMGKLGTQYCVKSEKAFSLLKEISTEAVEKSYYVKYQNRDRKARGDYSMLDKTYNPNHTYIGQIVGV